MAWEIPLYYLNVCKWKRYLAHSEPLDEIEVKMCQRTKKERSKYTCSCESRKIELVLLLLHNQLCNHVAKTKQNCKASPIPLYNYNLATTPTDAQIICKLTHLRMWCFWWSLATFPTEHCTRPWGWSFCGLSVPWPVRTCSHSGGQWLHVSQQASLPSFQFLSRVYIDALYAYVEGADLRVKGRPALLIIIGHRMTYRVVNRKLVLWGWNLRKDNCCESRVGSKCRWRCTTLVFPAIWK